MGSLGNKRLLSPLREHLENHVILGGVLGTQSADVAKLQSCKALLGMHADGTGKPLFRRFTAFPARDVCDDFGEMGLKSNRPEPLATMVVRRDQLYQQVRLPCPMAVLGTTCLELFDEPPHVLALGETANPSILGHELVDETSEPQVPVLAIELQPVHIRQYVLITTSNTEASTTRNRQIRRLPVVPQRQSTALRKVRPHSGQDKRVVWPAFPTRNAFVRQLLEDLEDTSRQLSIAFPAQLTQRIACIVPATVTSFVVWDAPTQSNFKKYRVGKLRRPEPSRADDRENVQGRFGVEVLSDAVRQHFKYHCGMLTNTLGIASDDPRNVTAPMTEQRQRTHLSFDLTLRSHTRIMIH